MSESCFKNKEDKFDNTYYNATRKFELRGMQYVLVLHISSDPTLTIYIFNGTFIEQHTHGRVLYRKTSSGSPRMTKEYNMSSQADVYQTKFIIYFLYYLI